MSIVLADRVQEITTTAGTGTVNLGGAVPQFQSFVTGVGNGNQTYYGLVNGNNWEVGIGTVTSGSPNTLSRATILASSNSGSAINLTGTSFVFGDAPAALLSTLANGTTGAGEVVLAASPTLSGTVAGNISWSGTQTITNSTDSTAPSSGALSIAGGLGVAGNLYVGPNPSDWISGSWIKTDGGATGLPSPDARMAVVGGTGDNPVLYVAGHNTSGAIIGICGFGVTDAPTGTNPTYAGYFEAQRQASASGSTASAQGIEIDICEFNSTPAPINPYSNGGTGVNSMSNALWLASGGAHPSVNPASLALGVINNGSTFLTGISFGQNAIAGATGTSGTGEAIALAMGHQINFYAYNSGSPGIAASIVSAATTTANPITLSFGIGSATLNGALNITGAAGTQREIQFETAGVPRWLFVGADNVAESGGNAGSDMFFARFSDAGSFIDLPLLISRATGVVACADGISVGTTILITGTAGFTNGAASSTGTLTNAPASGNPTKWIPINDNGTTRYIPAW